MATGTDGSTGSARLVYDLRVSVAQTKKRGRGISVSIVLPHGSTISDFDLAAFHRWLISSGYRVRTW